MKQIYFILAGVLLMLTQQGFSQSMSNTDNVITLTSTCMQAGMTSGTYDLELNYYDLDIGPQTKEFTGVTVAVSGSVMTITAPSGSFPTAAVNGYWSLPDTYNGHITLTKGLISTIMFWYQNPDGTIGFNCVALPTVIGNFFTYPGGATAVQLFWQTELEENSTFIEIWRSPTDSAHSFYKIGQLAAAGNSNSPVNYNFIDSNLDTRNYYYLKILNYDGTPPVYSDTISWRCDACHFTPPAPVNCPDSIIGPDQICAMETRIPYHLSSAVPDYSTIVWSVDKPASVKVGYTDDPAQVTLLRTAVPALVTLRAIMSGCTDTITRTFRVGPPDPIIEVLNLCPSRFILLDTLQAGATSWTWKVRNDSTGVTTTSHAPSVTINVLRHLNTWTATHTYTNACGISDSVVLVVGCGGGAGLAAQRVAAVELSPNPSNGMIGVSLLKADLTLDTEAMLAAIAEHQPAIVYLAYPNNPTGTLFDDADMERIIAAANKSLVVIDEAYQPFAQQSWLPRADAFDNVVVMRTVSKLGLAGIRLGYLVGKPAWLTEFDKVRPPYNTNVLTQAAADFLLDHIDVLDSQAAQLREERTKLAHAVAELPGAEVFPSAGNFLLVRVPDASVLFETLLAARVLIKNVSKMHPLLANCVRLTVGSPEENAQLLAGLKLVLH